MSDDIILKAIKAGLTTQLYGPQSVVLAKIQEDVAQIATLVGFPYAIVERACQELCSRHPETVNETLSKLLCSDVDTRREFFTIMQEQ